MTCAIFMNSNLQRYASRALYLLWLYFPSRIDIGHRDFTGQTLSFSLYRIQSLTEFGTGKKSFRLHFLSDDTSHRFGSVSAFRRPLIIKKGKCKIRDLALGTKFWLPEQDLRPEKVYRDMDSIEITCTQAYLRRLFIRHFFRICIDWRKKLS